MPRRKQLYQIRIALTNQEDYISGGKYTVQYASELAIEMVESKITSFENVVFFNHHVVYIALVDDTQ